MILNKRQIAHLLETLRYCQGKDLGHTRHFDETTPLTDEEADQLVEAINFGDAGPIASSAASTDNQQLFSVIGLFPDSEWDGSMWDASFVEHVTARTPGHAARVASLEAARKRIIKHYPDAESSNEEIAEMADNIEILAVFAGHLMDLYDRNALDAS